MARLPAAAFAPVRRLIAVLREVCAGATGADTYERYVAHLGARHPGRAIPTRAEFVRRQLAERWDGVRRCC